jgi:hypothetical protein
MRHVQLSKSLVIVLMAALVFVGAASAYAVRTIYLKPGHCTTVAKTRVCAREVKPTVKTITVSPSPLGKTFSGSGQQTLAPFTLAKGAMLHWTITNDRYGLGLSIYDTANGVVISSGNATSGQSYLKPGTYTLDINAQGDWTISF